MVTDSVVVLTYLFPVHQTVYEVDAGAIENSLEPSSKDITLSALFS